MEAAKTDSSLPAKRRNPRIDTYSFARVKMSSWNPFSVRDVTLVNISRDGMSVEFLTPIDLINKGTKVKVTIPLAQFGIMKPRLIAVKLIVRWCDTRTFRIGGELLAVPSDQIQLLDKVIEKVEQEGSDH